jgi:sugar phosphate isomerase/epimerase
VSPLGPSDLVLCAGTIPGASFRERVEAAADAGFAGISLFPQDYQRARAEGLRDADMRALLADRGIAVAELDPLMSWLPGADLAADASGEGEAFFRTTEAEFYAMADALGARSLNAVLYTDRAPSASEIADAFAALCDRAAEHGLLVHLEFLPWTPIADVRAALEIVELADRKNGGVMLDTWHHFRSGAANEELRRVPGERILAVQLNDAPREPEANPVEETLHRRLLPGDGAIDLVEIVEALRASRSPAPLGVEIFSDELAKLPPAEAAQRAARAARAVLEKASRRA